MTSTRVLLDGRPCASSTGIGRYARTLIQELVSGDNTRAYSLMSWRREASGLRALLGENCRILALFPGRVFAALEGGGVPLPASMLGWPAIFHGTSYTVPRLVSTPTIVTFYDIAFLRLPEAYPPGVAAGFDRTVRRELRYVSHIVTVSNFTKGELTAAYDIDGDRISVIYPAAIPRNGNQPTAKAKPQLTRPFMLFVGELGPRKNVLRLLQAFGRVCDSIPHSLVLAGPDGSLTEYSRAVRSEAVHLGIADRVLFTGWLPDHDLAELYSNCEAVLLPSLYEGFGFPLVDAMQYGKPVVTSNLSSMPEVVEGAALLVDPLVVDEIAEAILTLARDSVVRNGLAELGRRRVAAFTASGMVDSFCRLYTALEQTDN